MSDYEDDYEDLEPYREDVIEDYSEHDDVKDKKLLNKYLNSIENPFEKKDNNNQETKKKNHLGELLIDNNETVINQELKQIQSCNERKNSKRCG